MITNGVLFEYITQAVLKLSKQTIYQIVENYTANNVY